MKSTELATESSFIYIHVNNSWFSNLRICEITRELVKWRFFRPTPRGVLLQLVGAPKTFNS